MIPNPKAIVFDLDGTLIDSEPWHKRAEVEAFGLFGIHISDADLKPFTGQTLPDLLAGIGGRFGQEITVEQFLQVQAPILGRYVQESMEPFEDTWDLARGAGVPIALATSSMEWYLNAVRARFTELDRLFAIQLCQRDVANGKPDPEIFLKAFDRLGVAPCEGWVLEDSLNGVRAARAAGAFAIGVDREGSGWLAEADLVVRSVSELSVH